jgi:hypothetical protein
VVLLACTAHGEAWQAEIRVLVLVSQRQGRPAKASHAPWVWGDRVSEVWEREGKKIERLGEKVEDGTGSSVDRKVSKSE